MLLSVIYRIHHRSFQKMKLQFQTMTLRTCKIPITRFHISVVVNSRSKIRINACEEELNR